MTAVDRLRVASLPMALLLIGGSIYYLERQKPGGSTASDTAHTITSNVSDMNPGDKARMFPLAKEITSPAGFINTDDITVQELVGDKVILVDFWTYSCINCQRTLPYLNAWHEKYHEQGLVILGVHTPEFAFEKKRENVQAAVDKYGIRYPVILDNDYATWRAYGNRYWPRKYLIDIDGYIVYDHIGEGAYEETERKIQELLRERADRLGASSAVPAGLAPATPPPVHSASKRSPEIYFGAARNEQLGNGQAGQTGQQHFTLPTETKLNQLYLDGSWELTPEYATVFYPPARVVMRYQAQEVYMVAGANQSATLTITRNGQPLGAAAGEDVTERNGTSVVTVQAERLYHLIKDADAGEHELEITIDQPGVQLFTFTFG